MNMRLDEGEPFPLTCVELHEVDVDGATGPPAVVPVQAPTRAGNPILTIVAGPFSHPAARAQAARIGMQQRDEVLRVAVFDIGADAVPPQEAQLDELHAAFHAVMVVTHGQRRQVVSRLVRSILRLDGQDQWIGCDWHDVSHIVKASRGAPVRSGCGHAVGAGRAALASLEAIRQTDRQGPGLRAARGICIGIRAASNTVYGREIKEVIQRICAWTVAGATITMSIGSDSSLKAGAIEVDIFAFGQFDEAELARQGVRTEDALLDPRHFTRPACQGQETLRDPLYVLARSLVMQHQRASISLVQRKLRIGYGRACALLDSMEGDILSPRSEDGMRKVLVAGQAPQSDAHVLHAAHDPLVGPLSRMSYTLHSQATGARAAIAAPCGAASPVLRRKAR